MTDKFIMVAYGKFGWDYGQFINDVISCWRQCDNCPEVFQSVGNNFFWKTQVCNGLCHSLCEQEKVHSLKKRASND